MFSIIQVTTWDQTPSGNQPTTLIQKPNGPPTGCRAYFGGQSFIPSCRILFIMLCGINCMWLKTLPTLCVGELELKFHRIVPETLKKMWEPSQVHDRHLDFGPVEHSFSSPQEVVQWSALVAHGSLNDICRKGGLPTLDALLNLRLSS